MSTREAQKKRRKLTQELLHLIVLNLILSIVFYFCVNSWAGTMAYHYCEKNQIGMDDLQSIVLDSLISNLSVIGAVILFVVLFLVFVGRKLAYIRDITGGIDALRAHRMNDEVPLAGNNELTELAERINYLAETERKLKAAEQELQEEKAALIRGLSHDIRTPLTAILSYTEYLQSRGDLSQEEMGEFLELTRRKAEQMKTLTARLLDGGGELVEVEDGRLLMEQLAGEWIEMLEDDFQCQIDCSTCPNFCGRFDIEELRRIFDNLASNVMKYADASATVKLMITEKDGRIAIRQSNWKAAVPNSTESRGIGLESVRRIAGGHGGGVHVMEDESHFSIELLLFTIGEM